MPSTNGHGPEPERVALYLRVSSEEQRDAGTIQTQREFLKGYYQLHGLEVAETYADDGISGTILLHERPEGKRLLEDAKKGRFGAVLVYRLDRLGRALLVVVDAHDQLQVAGAALVSATEHIDTSTPSGRLHFQMLGSFAEFERASIRERTRDGLHRLYRNGRHTGACPYGYSADDRGLLQIVPEEAAIVREIITNIAEGSNLYREVKRLNDLAITPPGWRYRSGKKLAPGKRWCISTISNIVRHSTYSGTHVVKINAGEDRIEQTVPAIVDRRLQEQARETLAENKRFSGGPVKRRNYLLSGLITCEVCGCSCTGRIITARGKKYPYYRCSDDHALRGRRAPANHAPHVNARWLEETVWNDVKLFLEHPGEVLERVREQMGSGDAHAELEARHADLTKRLAAKSVEKDRYVRAYAQDLLSEEELAEYVTDLKNQIENLKLLIGAVEDELKGRREHVEIAETVEAWLLTLRERVSEIEEETHEAFAKRRELVKLLVERIDAGRDENGRTKIEVRYRFGPPEGPDPQGEFVGGVQDSKGSGNRNGRP
jgi:site-specific DNA recombinase